MFIVRGFGPSRPNIRNSCLELGKAGVSDVTGFASCQACPECRGAVRSIGSGALFQKLLKVVALKLRGQSDLMADVSVLENVGERVRINPSVSILALYFVLLFAFVAFPVGGFGAFLPLFSLWRFLGRVAPP
ncbi:hypothetical protein PIB30_055109 [Stylosanthes scabra]|uniref:Uncharacterized protein n=1 Tax=Stylosanthes scabra TaxID=79078 RepID=A0ABU6UIU3_9FABA|nr:hypothetical protein [Stylosanthes scabra]